MVGADTATSHDELLFTTTDSMLEVLHGGKRIRFAAGGGYQWNLSRGVGSWVSTASVSDTIANATTRSKAGLNHGWPLQPARDTSLTVSKAPLDANHERFTVSRAGVTVATADGPWIGRAQNRTSVCVMWDIATNDCYAGQTWTTYQDSITSSYAVGYSPAGDTLVLAISRDSVAAYVGDVIPMGTYSYRTYGQIKKTIGTDVYYIAAGGSVRTPWHVVTRVERIGLAEDGRHVVMQTRNLLFYSVLGDGQATFTQYNLCQGEYALSSGTSVFRTQIRHLPNFSNTTPCFPGTTFAP
jgi:hypothetical protein